MFIGTTGRSGVLITALALLTGAAILRGAAAAADPNQDDRFLALLDQEGIPALQGVPNLIETAHDVCRTLDAGMPAAGLVDAMVNNAFGIDPAEREYAPGRLARTEARFITAAVGAYCPYNQGKIASIRANRTGWNGSTRRIVVVPSGEITDPNPPQIPTPPPAAQIQAPRQPVAAPPPPKQPPPPAQKPPPPRQVAEPPPQAPPPPAAGPQPGGAGGGSGGASGGGGGNGGGNTGGGGVGVQPDPSPGFVRLAP
ncbi:hypothetical protein AWB91_03385 [Mycobacterium paraense]|uniref:DUF732 domain-containing protein n=1 Tax=Mycobacterium paraense TaxID=767916 RepID=A0ABX3VG27_9MYCO|nr:DUF732 domain-containing protein [Mycobacterium paraense]MCV7443987.1 DUF732 domain-containing protein [Mycobacterium paraense]ORW27357.1 hypothetical protein AWB91_03385 [Mycobacterium paraense]ORW43929.1 hypothetical protein AWB88_06670 [Mycobacterium paraense]ORW47711.1 hypothetical protein AWB89_07915 [Mycobacterium paraense]